MKIPNAPPWWTVFLVCGVFANLIQGEYAIAMLLILPTVALRQFVNK